MILNMEVLGKRTGTDNEHASLDRLCELCEFDSVNTQANGFCNGCEQYMCSACFSQHIRAKSCRHHTLSDINMSSDNCLRSNARPIQCKQHETEIIKYYCRTHEAVGCGDCIVSKHNACKSEFIKDLSDNFQQNEDYKTFVKKTETQISKTKELENKIQENKKDNELMLEKSLQDIKQFRLDINKYLDKVETDITCQARKVMEENNTLLAKLENSCSMLSTTLEEIAKLLNSELYKDNVLFIHTVECKPKLPEVEKAISDMRLESMKKYEFVYDQQLNSLVTSAQQLGVLSISASAMFPQATKYVNEKGASSYVVVEDTVKDNLISEGQAQGVKEYMSQPDVMHPQFVGGPPHLGMDGRGGLQMKSFAFMEPRGPEPLGDLQMPTNDYQRLRGPYQPQLNYIVPPLTDHLPSQHGTTRHSKKGADGDLILRQDQKERDQGYSTTIKGSRRIIKDNGNTIEIDMKKVAQEKMKVLDVTTKKKYENNLGTDEDVCDMYRKVDTWSSRTSESERDKENYLTSFLSNVAGLVSLVEVGDKVKHNTLSNVYGTGTITCVHGDGAVTVTWEHGGELERHNVGVKDDDVTVVNTAITSLSFSNGKHSFRK